MKAPKLPLPKAPDLIREALIVVGGAIIAAAIVGQIPPLREWIKKQWDGAPKF
jgi:hypothetical protein